MGCSVLILAKNESAHLAECMKSCSSFATEFVVIDDFSTDDTKAIAESFPNTQVFQRALNNDFGTQQTFGLTQCKEPWIFMIDADERCTLELAREIAEIVKGKPDTAYWVMRIIHFAQKEMRHGTLSPDRVLRLVPKEGTTMQGLVHQKTCVTVPQKRCKATLKHYTYQDWSQYERKMMLYSTVAAQKYFEEGKPSHFVVDVLFRPLVSFLKMYIFKLGFLDGTMGLLLSRQYANYTMAKYIKLAELYRQTKQGK